MNKYYIYTDGSYREGIYAGAFCVYTGTKCIYKSSGCGIKASSMNNVAGELTAVMRAARWTKKQNAQAVIVHDYTGISKWVDGSWRTNNEWTKAYKKFITPYVKDGTISFKWVKGHNGDLGNALADELARHALRDQKEWVD